MPVKKSVRRKQSTRVAFVGRSVKFAKSMNLAKVMNLKKLTNLTTGMDTAIVLPLVGLVFVAVLIGAQTRSHNADQSTDAVIAQADSSIVDGSGVPPIEAGHDSEPAAPNQVAQSAPVTITGCLERDDETFRLEDTSGADAPRSRSWKSAFLKKRAASVEVVDASSRLRLTNHVGQRVSVTGTMSDGEMQIRSLRRVAASCKAASQKVSA
jgi:hypothetical protein